MQTTREFPSCLLPALSTLSLHPQMSPQWTDGCTTEEELVENLRDGTWNWMRRLSS